MRSSNLEYVENPQAPVPPVYFYGASYLWGVTWDRPSGSPLGEVPLDPDRLLHAEEELVLHGEPPRAGDWLTATTTLGDSYEKTSRSSGKTMRFFVAVTEFRSQNGTLVAEARNTAVEMPHTEEDGA